MALCQICKKGPMAGRTIHHKHSGLWERKAPAKPRVFDVNIQKRKVMYFGALQSGSFCTKCIKKLRKSSVWKGYSLQLPAYEKGS